MGACREASEEERARQEAEQARQGWRDEIFAARAQFFNVRVIELHSTCTDKRYMMYVMF